jgi:hypothetical protein
LSPYASGGAGGGVGGVAGPAASSGGGFPGSAGAWKVFWHSGHFISVPAYWSGTVNIF